MPRRPDILCAGTCGRLIWRGRGTLPEGQSMCNACRRARGRLPSRRQPRTAATHPCPDCAIPVAGYRTRRCDSCRPLRYRAREARKGEKRKARRRASAPPKPHINWPPVKAAVMRSCDWCGDPTRLRFCSKQHSDQWWNAERSRLRGPRLCVCGEPTTSPRHHRCDRCRESSRRTRKLYERRRSREGFIHEPYTLAEIAARDNYRCGICRGKVRMDCAVPHYKAPTIDHVIPIAELGPDIPANVRLAHFICNSRRGTGGVDQLVLFG